MGILDKLREREIRPMEGHGTPDLNDPRDRTPDSAVNGTDADDTSGSGSEAPPHQEQEVAQVFSDSASTVSAGSEAAMAGAGVMTPDRPFEPAASPGEGAGVVSNDIAFPEEIGESPDLEAASKKLLENIGGDVTVVVRTTPSAEAALKDYEAAPGKAKQGIGHGVGHALESGQQISERADRTEAAANKRSLKAAAEPQPVEPGTEAEAFDRSLLNYICVDDASLISKKLKRFSKAFYLNPMMWDAGTLAYIISSYKLGITLKTIHDKISSPSRNFADAKGNLLPTFQNIRPEIGAVRIIDIYALLATCMYQTACSSNMTIKALDTKETMAKGQPVAKAIHGIGSNRPMRHDGEIHPTTFVDLIYHDILNPGALGHLGLSDWLMKYGESMSPGLIRRVYDTVLIQSRTRWRGLTGLNATKKANNKTTAGVKIIRHLDEALSRHTAILDMSGRRFLLMEWPEELPSSLPKFGMVEASLPISDMRLFLRKFTELFDESQPFTAEAIAVIRQQLGPSVTSSTVEGRGKFDSGDEYEKIFK